MLRAFLLGFRLGRSQQARNATRLCEWILCARVLARGLSLPKGRNNSESARTLKGFGPLACCNRFGFCRGAVVKTTSRGRAKTQEPKCCASRAKEQLRQFGRVV